MKTIDTLVEDIYNLFDPMVTNTIDEKELDKHLKEFTKNVTNNIKTVLNEQPRKQRKLSLSAIGKPTRQLWYDKHSSSEARPISSATRIKFLYGHILEDLLILLSRASGHTVTEEQKQVDVEGIKGHQDCKIDNVLVDCKSASGYAFKKFANNRLADDDPFGYIAQISAYSAGNNVKEACFLAIDKQHGNIALTRVHDLEMIDAKERIKYLKGALESKRVPDRCYSDIPEGISGNRKLAIGCVFCAHKRECWSDANNGQGLRAFKYEKGTTYLTQVYKEPRVQEIIDW
tara:strand:+ start:7184 stop:8047 length:864 start_codon:yes stop_codon:yes gene_type:complete